MIFTTSWDDGHPCDERVAAMLEHYGLSGTFFVPIRNREGHPVMHASAIRELDRRFEVGSHTLDHVYLTGLSSKDCNQQVVSGKQELEDILGHTVAGFCYPGGKINASVRQITIDAGFDYARGIKNLWLNPGIDRFDVKTTIQFYPHHRQVLWRNFIREGNYFDRIQTFRTIAIAKDWLSAMIYLVELQAETDTVIHIWGHSWEIEKRELWPQLETFFRLISEFRPQTCTVEALLKQDTLLAGSGGHESN